MHTMAFDGRIVVLGFGSVARCTLPLILRHIQMPPSRITVLDMEDLSQEMGDYTQQGCRFVRCKVTPDNYQQVLAELLDSGDILLDLAWNIETAALLAFCRQRNIRYLNTSVELWDPYTDADCKPTVDRTLYVRQMAIRKMMQSWPSKPSPTAILEHGANPGLVSHFAKFGLRDIARKIIAEKPSDPRCGPLSDALANNAFHHVARLVGLKVIHISERDSQVGNIARSNREFLNTWSVEGFFEEATSPAELGWGTHEHMLPADARVHHSGPRNQICLARYGMDTHVRSRVPSGEIVGMVIRHGEAFSISECLTVCGSDGTPVYRPTVHYAYLPCDAAVASLHELRNRNYSKCESWRIMSNEIVSGVDELGCLLMGHDYKSWWTGTVLDINEARKLVPGQNATTVQVACSVLSAVCYMLRHPNEGVRLPDELPFDEILEVARPYLGRLVSEPLDWMPDQNRSTGLHGDRQTHRDHAAIRNSTAGHSHAENDPWQFSRFLVV